MPPAIMPATGAVMRAYWLFRQKIIFTPESFLQQPIIIMQPSVTIILSRKNNAFFFAGLIT
jgi:hypothetical protein